MKIEIHGLNVVFHDARQDDILEVLDILGIDFDQFKISKFGNATIFKYSFEKKKESVRIKANDNNGLHYVRMDLKGAFFDNSPDFSLENLLNYLARFKHTFKQLDVAFMDDERHLTKKEIKRWCSYSDDYCVGSLVKREAPIVAYQKRKLLRIQLDSARSKFNFGTIYKRPDTRYLRIEIKFKKKEKINYLLEDFSSENVQQFEIKCLRALLSCINFITPGSKKKRVASKYKMQPSWRAFIGSELKSIKWRDIYRKKRNSRHDRFKADVAAKNRSKSVDDFFIGDTDDDIFS